MRKTAKIIAVLTAAMITVSLTACSGGNAASTTAAFQTTVGTGVIEAETEK